MTNGRTHIYRPGNVDVKLWRYMDCMKFLDVLQERALWFTRLDQLQDPHEGSFPKALREQLSVLAVESPEYGGFTYEKWRKRGCVNCWHASDCESAAMWSLYSGQDGIAFCSHVSRLELAFHDESEFGSWGLYGNEVQYGDSDAYDPPKDQRGGSDLIRAKELHRKRKSFQHEREYRLTSTLEDSDQGSLGKYIRVSLEKLIEGIVVAPTAPKWVVEIIRKELVMHCLKVEVTQSNLYTPVLK